MPIAAQPVGEQADGVVIEDFVFGEGGHSVVAFAEEAGVGRVRDEGQKPFARAVAGEIGPGNVLVRLVKLMALGAAHGLAGNQRFAFRDHRGVALVGGMLGFKRGFGG